MELRVDLNFIFLLLFVLLSDSLQFGTLPLARAVVLVGMILFSVTLHELGHAFVAARQRLPIRGVILTPVGGLALVEPHEEMERARSLPASVAIAVAGPVMNLFLAAIIALVVVWFKHPPGLFIKPLLSTQALVRSFFWTNIFLFALNLLPGLPMDGGRVLRAWLTRTMSFDQATRRAVSLGHGCAFTFMLLGPAFTPWLMLVGVFIFMAAQREERTAMFQSLAQSMRVEEIMLTDFSTLSPADTLEDALGRAVHSLQDDFPVVRGGDLVGVINRQTIMERLRREGNGYVQGAMSRGFEIASRTESLTSAMRKLSTRKLTLIPVVDQERLVGIVTLQSLMHSVGLLAESRRLKRTNEEV